MSDIHNIHNTHASYWLDIYGTEESKKKKDLDDRIYNILGKYQWQIIIFLAILSVGLSWWGFYFYLKSIAESATFFDYIYLIFSLYTFNANYIGSLPLPLQIGRLIPVVVLGFTFIKGILYILRERRVERKIRRLKNHNIICGAGEKGLELAKHFDTNNEHVVLIEKDEDGPNLEAIKELGAYVLKGDATNDQVLIKAHFYRAKNIILLAGNDNTNISILHSMLTVLDTKKTKKIPNIFIHIEDEATINLFEQYNKMFLKKISKAIKTFSMNKLIAKTLFQYYYLENWVDTRDKNAPAVHIALFQFNDLGKKIILEAARLCHYANHKKLKISIIDPEINKKIQKFLYDYPKFEKICDFTPLNYVFEDLSILKGNIWHDNNLTTPNIIINCIDDDIRSLNTTLSIIPYFRRSQTKNNIIPIFIKMSEDEGIARIFETSDKNLFDNIEVVPFGTFEHVYRPEWIVEDILSKLGKTAHEIYRKQKIKDLKEKNENIDTYPQKDYLLAWDDLPEEIREENLRQADHIPIKIRGINADIRKIEKDNPKPFQFTDEEIELMASMEQERWMAERYIEGWDYGEVRDDSQKLNPYMVPYENLSEEIKEYSRNSAKEIINIMKNLGYEIYRK